ncbi:MAG: hypothetical protein CVU64_09580 [Deltaproteobacteria bacterium HGW-Deltaproteobacteria-21]|nr:MAG: hypothetical protein CVU64_09580 [Deltaproteobacteria bacterium HGW-Deltaproteobacteria-21]
MRRLIESRSSRTIPAFDSAEWAEVLDVAERSFAYNAANGAYFVVSNLRRLENLTLEELLEL